MSDRKVYHVVPKQGDWSVKAENAERASNTFQNKDAAVARAKELAKSNPEGQVVIHKQDGKIQTEHTYKNDSYPPKG